MIASEAGRSKLVLGTVQLGMPYGIANTAGPPSKEGAFKILDTAFEGGINTFDTASAYGSAEELLGEWIAARTIKKSVYIVSKVTGGSGSIRSLIEQSLQRLHIEQLDGCLLHSSEHLCERDVMDDLQQAKQDGLVGHVGVSIYDEADAQKALDVGMEYVQIPYNVFDQRLERADFFDRATAAGITVFARSPFLQGLLLMDPDAVPPHLSAARQHLEKFIEMSQRHGLSQLEAALLFAHGSRAEHVIFGAESRKQVAGAIGIIQNKTMSVDLIEEIRESFQNVDRSIIDPRLWTKHN